MAPTTPGTGVHVGAGVIVENGVGDATGVAVEEGEGCEVGADDGVGNTLTIVAVTIGACGGAGDAL